MRLLTRWEAELMAGELSVERLSELDEPGISAVCLEAAGFGHIKCLQLAHRCGLPWDEHTSAAAMDNGQRECLEYAFRNGCPSIAQILPPPPRNNGFEIRWELNLRVSAILGLLLIISVLTSIVFSEN